MGDSLPSEWRTLPLEECMDKIIDYRGKSPEKTTSGVPLVTAKIVKSGRIEPVTEYIAESDYDDWMRRGIPQKGDVVITTEAPLGEVAQLDGRKIALAQRIITLRGKNNTLDNTYLKFFLVSEAAQEQLHGRSTGTTVLGIRQSELRCISITLPPFPEQRAIAHVLGSLDDKMELNRQINEMLEEMARTLFISWFVDFDPVRAKAEGLQPEGMDSETAALFPSELVESELGMIPQGWRVCSLPEVMDINPSRKLAKGEVAPYLDMGNMPTSSARALEVYDREFGSGTKFQNGDTLVARITPCLENGKTAFVDFLEEGQVGWGSTEYIVLRPKTPLPNEFAYFLARTDDFRTFAISNMTGSSGRQRVPSDCFSNYKIAVPTEEIAEAFGRVAQDFLAQMKLHDEQSETLAEQRQQLLPKLISGELRLPEDLIAEFEE